MRFAPPSTYGLCLFALLVLLFAPGLAAADSDKRLAKARVLFEQFVARSDSFDPSVSDFYYDDARIVAYRSSLLGTERRMDLRGAQYKSIIRKIMPAAQIRGDRSEYFNVTYAPEGSGVRIGATRRSLLKGYTAPHSMLVVPDGSGAWRILEEVIRTQP